MSGIVEKMLGRLNRNHHRWGVSIDLLVFDQELVVRLIKSLDNAHITSGFGFAPITKKGTCIEYWFPEAVSYKDMVKMVPQISGLKIINGEGIK